MRHSGRAEQLRPTKGFSARSLHCTIAWAMSSLPTPLSPAEHYRRRCEPRPQLLGRPFAWRGWRRPGRKRRPAFDLLNQSAAFDLQRTLFDGARENDLQFIIVDGEKKEFVGSGLAGFQRNRALIAARECHNDDVIANFANLFENLSAIDGAVADRIQIE